MSLDFESISPLVHRDNASCAIRVPRAGSLPTASFRFNLAVDTLAVRLEVPDIKPPSGLKPNKSLSGSLSLTSYQASVKTLRVMPDAPKKKARDFLGLGLSITSTTDDR